MYSHSINDNRLRCQTKKWADMGTFNTEWTSDYLISAVSFLKLQCFELLYQFLSNILERWKMSCASKYIKCYVIVNIFIKVNPNFQIFMEYNVMRIEMYWDDREELLLSSFILYPLAFSSIFPPISTEQCKRLKIFLKSAKTFCCQIDYFSILIIFNFFFLICISI